MAFPGFLKLSIPILETLLRVNMNAKIAHHSLSNGNKGYKSQPPRIDDDVSIGAGAVILPGVTIGCGSMIGAGAIVTKDVPSGTVLRGDPSRISRCVSVNA